MKHVYSTINLFHNLFSVQRFAILIPLDDFFCCYFYCFVPVIPNYHLEGSIFNENRIMACWERHGLTILSITKSPYDITCFCMENCSRFYVIIRIDFKAIWGLSRERYWRYSSNSPYLSVCKIGGQNARIDI